MPEQSFAAGLVGIVLDGRYRLDALLGEGGMGAVFRAQHLAMDRKVAVKLLKPHLTSNDVALQRFAREARSTLKVDSPHAVKVLDFGITPQRDYYMVLEYLDGRTVQRELEVDGPFAPDRVVRIAKQALLGLAAAHACGIVHRDIKPDNLLLLTIGDDPDFTKVLDFGVAKLLDGAARSAQSALALTQAGMVYGTPEFMSPEQACGQALDGRSDLYSLAATMFAMLTGRGMYVATTPLEWLTAHARQPAPHLADGRPELAALTALDAVLQQCFAKSRDRRPDDAAAMLRLLESVEPTLDPGASKPGRSGRETMFSASSFVAALPVPTTSAPAGIGAPTSDQVPARSGRRGLWFALGALVIVGMIAVAIGVAASKRVPSSEPPPRPARGSDLAAKPIDTAALADAALPVDAAAPPDAPAVDAGVVHAPPRSSADAARHLAAAEQALREKQFFREMIEADAALHADPHSTRAKFLLGDGLISMGDLDHGCKYLRELPHLAMAVARARAAGCPND